MTAEGVEAESSAAGEQRRVPFARGGPVFVPSMLGPLSTVTEFMSSALGELQSLQDELGDPGDEFDEEFSVDELRVLSEEELVERALREAMEEGWDSGAPTHEEVQRSDAGMLTSSTAGNRTVTLSLSTERKSSRTNIDNTAITFHEPQRNNGKTRHRKGKTRGNEGNNLTITSDASVKREISGTPVDMAIVPSKPQGSQGKERTMPSNSFVESKRLGSPFKEMAVVPCDPEGEDGQTKCRKGKKRGRHFDREVRADIYNYLAKAEKMAEIKVKQEEDKCAARLHSFSGDSMTSKGCKVPAEKIDMSRSLKSISAPWKNKASKSEEHRPVAYPEVILCVEVYEQRYSSVKKQEFLVLGSQLLTDLKDNMSCLTDKLMELSKQHNPSGFFLIEDTFYNDTRHRSAIDYSKPILDWFRNPSHEAAEKWDTITSGVLKKRQKNLLCGLNTSNLPEFQSAKMQKTCFSDLHFRLGAGYLYCHQGNCKHMIVFRDISLIHPEDTQNRVEYPLVAYQLQKRRQKCSVCQIYVATKMTVDDKWAQNNPCYFCIQCYYLLHYKEDGSLLYSHTVYDYLQE